MSLNANVAALPASASPQDRVLRVQAATFSRRALAVSIDALLLTVIVLAVLFACALVLDVKLPTAREFGPDLLVAGMLDRNPMAVGAVGLLFGQTALYHFYMVGLLGQTIGLRVCGLRVISSRGTTPGPARGLLRFLAICLSVMPAGLGWLWCLFDRERRALHDHLAGTYVIFDR
ncbi:MAG: RDD family protein [Deltaproteobacteria bacterium]|nr:RDD family protein [Deltaproteobacteria bacterium]